MNTWLILVLAILLIGYLFETVSSLLTLKALQPNLPEEFSTVYQADDYAKSQQYTRAKIHLSLLSTTLTSLATLLFLLLGGFNIVDLFARGFGYGEIVTGIIFCGCLALLGYLINLPFSIYSTFVIEERFDFNRMTPGMYVADTLKGAALTILLGAPLLSLILWFFLVSGHLAWIYCWLGVFCFSILMQFLAPVVILPLFNTFSALEDGALKEQIIHYAEQEKFQLQGIFTMDGSKRSTKLNAFFTGFGKFRKIVFYDTLMAKLDNEEIIAVLAHEMGHFKLKHIIKMIAASALHTGILFFLLSRILNNPQLFEAFSMDYISIYASLVFFGFIVYPVNMLVSIAFNYLSRKHEFEADSYAVRTTGLPEKLISGLKQLSQANLANLTPHPLVVFLEYTHPPVLKRIQAIRQQD